MWCVGFLDDMIFCNIFARWLQKIVATCYAMCWFFWDMLVFWDAMIFCNDFARWLQKIVASWDAMCWVFWDAMNFCNNFARWLHKIVATCDVMRCWQDCCPQAWSSSSFPSHRMALAEAQFFWDAMIFCNHLAKLLQKIVHVRCVGFLGCYDLL